MAVGEALTTTNGVDPGLTKVIEIVKRLEEGLEALEELINENHQETLERIDDLNEGGRGFSTFES